MDTDKKTMIVALLGHNNIMKLGYFFLRVFLGSTFIIHGASKLFGGMMVFSSTVDNFGIPFAGSIAYVIAYTEFIAGIFLVLGLMTRISALAVMVIMYGAIYLVHFNDPYAVKELAAVYFFVSLLFFLDGGGDHSLDSLLLDGMHYSHKSKMHL